MVIIDAPYASEPLLDWLEETSHPVLKNDFSAHINECGRNLNLVDDAQAERLILGGQRVYTNSENALAWIDEHVPASDLDRSIRIFKDKAETRRVLAPLSPSLFFKTCSRDELATIDPASLPLPVVLKPAIGFCSMGVYAIEKPDDWFRALEDIEQRESVWNERYPESVVDPHTYIIEGYLSGDEYAIDMYFDGAGIPRILNILRHDFLSEDDTSDRMYVTSAKIVSEMEPIFTQWLISVNDLIGAKDFPAHVEVRVCDGNVIPIEFNPLRFAGLGGTDVAFYGFGLRTYAAYLEHEEVDLNEMLRAHPEEVFSVSLLNPAPDADLSAPFDHDALLARFSHVLGFSEFDVNKVGAYGFLFLSTDESTQDELAFLLKSDLKEFLR